MVEKRFELVGISEMSIMYQGLIYPPKKRVVLRVCESDKDFYSQFMSVESVKELKDETRTAGVLKIADEPVVVSKVENTIAEVVEKPKPIPKPKSKTTTQTNRKTTTQKKTTTNKTKK